MKDLHLLFGDGVSAKVQKLSKKYDYSISGFLNLVLCLGLARFEKKYYTKGDKRSQWKRVGGAAVRRHVFVNVKTYRRLKGLHVVCNVYSMGQIVRRVVGLVLFLIERWGFERTVAFFREGNRKHREKCYNIGEGSGKNHMHIKEAVRVAFSAEMVPIAVEYQ